LLGGHVSKNSFIAALKNSWKLHTCLNWKMWEGVVLTGEGEKRNTCKHCFPFEQTTGYSVHLSSFQIYTKISTKSLGISSLSILVKLKRKLYVCHDILSHLPEHPGLTA